jgi:capsid protein
VYRLAQVDRVRSVLASSVLTPVLTPARSLVTYLNHEDRAKHIEACVSLQLTKLPGYAGKAGQGIGMSERGTQAELTDANGRSVKRMESGTIYDPPPGTELKTVASNRPGTQFESYVKRREYQIAAGSARSRSAVSREFTASYTAERRGEVEDHKGNRLWHERSVAQVLMPLRRLFIDMAIVMGKVKVPAAILRDPDLREGLYETEWMPPRREPLDPSRDAASKKIRLDYKLDNHGRILNEEGRDWHENFDDIEEQAAYAKERGIPLPHMQPGGAGPVSPNEARPRGTSNAPDGAGDGGDEESGDDETENGGARVSLVEADALAEAGVQA